MADQGRWPYPFIMSAMAFTIIPALWPQEAMAGGALGVIAVKSVVTEGNHVYVDTSVNANPDSCGSITRVEITPTSENELETRKNSGGFGALMIH